MAPECCSLKVVGTLLRTRRWLCLPARGWVRADPFPNRARGVTEAVETAADRWCQGKVLISGSPGWTTGHLMPVLTDGCSQNQKAVGLPEVESDTKTPGSRYNCIRAATPEREREAFKIMKANGRQLSAFRHSEYTYMASPNCCGERNRVHYRSV